MTLVAAMDFGKYMLMATDSQQVQVEDGDEVLTTSVNKLSTLDHPPEVPSKSV